MNSLLRLVFAGLVLALAGCSKPAIPKITTQPPNRTAPWTDKALDAAARIPIQDGGRVKPLDSYARFALLQFSAKRSLEVLLDGREEKLSSLEWLLDVMFFPRQAADYPVILVEDYDVLSDVGISITGLKKRDRYAYSFLVKAQPRMFEKARSYSARPEEQRTKLEKQVIQLAMTMMQYEHLQYALHYAREFVDLETTYPSLAADFPDQKRVAIADFVPSLPEFADRWESMNAAQGEEPSQEMRELSTVLSDLNTLVQVEQDSNRQLTHPFRLFPAPPGAEEWFTPGMVIQHSFASVEGIDEPLALFSQIASIMPSRYRSVDMATLEQGLVDFSAKSREVMVARGEGKRLDLEVSFYQRGWLPLAQWIFVAALMVGCLLWLAPRQKALYGFTWLVTASAFALLVIGITIRCIVRERPPVSTLYESILFITAVFVFAAFLLEAITKKRIALFLAAFTGALGSFLAAWYEELSGVDTMPQLQAVLDTNFWLSTHVTCITIGYAAGYLAAAIGHVFLLCKLFARADADPGFFRLLTRMVYGSIGFCVVFSTVGTILGGIWANDSWGRFWGWDPKENGALMIVLASLILLHARLGGFIKEFGLSLGSVLLSIVVTFSWFHTNQLGIGLHAYGFDQEIHDLVMKTYGVESAFFALGCLAWLRWRVIERGNVVVAQPASSAAKPSVTG